MNDDSESVDYRELRNLDQPPEATKGLLWFLYPA